MFYCKSRKKGGEVAATLCADRTETLNEEEPSVMVDRRDGADFCCGSCGQGLFADEDSSTDGELRTYSFRNSYCAGVFVSGTGRFHSGDVPGLVRTSTFLSNGWVRGRHDSRRSSKRDVL